MHACSAKSGFVRVVVTIIGILDIIFGELDGLLFFAHFYFCFHMLDFVDYFVDFVDMFKWIMLVEEEGSLLGAAVLVVAFIVLIILIWPQPIKGDDGNNNKKKRRKKKPVEDKGPIDPNDLLY